MATDPTIEGDDSTATQVVDPAALGVTAPIPTGIPPATDVPGLGAPLGAPSEAHSGVPAGDVPASEPTTMLPPGGLPSLGNPAIPAQGEAPVAESAPETLGGGLPADVPSGDAFPYPASPLPSAGGFAPYAASYPPTQLPAPSFPQPDASGFPPAGAAAPFSDPAATGFPPPGDPAASSYPPPPATAPFGDPAAAGGAPYGDPAVNGFPQPGAAAPFGDPAAGGGAPYGDPAVNGFPQPGASAPFSDPAATGFPQPGAAAPFSDPAAASGAPYGDPAVSGFPQPGASAPFSDPAAAGGAPYGDPAVGGFPQPGAAAPFGDPAAAGGVPPAVGGFPQPGAAAPAGGFPPPGGVAPQQGAAGPSRVFGPEATPVPQQWTPAGLLPMPEHADSRLQRLRTSVRSSSRAAREAAGIARELSQPVTAGRRIAVLGIRGGSGKSTVAALLVSAYATHRGDRVLAVDADPDLGSLGLRLGANSPTSLATLGRVPRVWSTLDEAERCLGRSQSGAWILSGERGAAAPETVPPNAYLGVLHGIGRYFAVTVVDAGAGMVTPLNQAVLADAHAIVLATPASVDGVVSARRALEWIREWNPHRLAQSTIALTAMSPQAADIDLNRAAEAFAPFGVVPALLPYDRHLATGSTIEPWRLGERTRNSAVQLAAATLVKARALP